MAKPVRWTEEEKRQMVITRSQNQHLSWEEFQKNLWPNRTVGALTFMYSEIKRMDRLRAIILGQNIPEHPSSEQSVSNAAKRTAEAMGEDETVCLTANSPARPPHAAKRPCTQDANGGIEQQIDSSPNRGHSKSTDPQSPDTSPTRQTVINTGSQNLTIDHAPQFHPCQSDTQNELIQAAHVGEEPANGLPLPCSVRDATPSEPITNGPTPVRRSERSTSQCQSVDKPVVNEVESDIADLAQRFCDDVSHVRKRRPMDQLQQSDLSEVLLHTIATFSSAQSSLLDLKHKVQQREDERNRALNSLKELQPQIEKQVKEVFKQLVSEKDAQLDRLQDECRARSRDNVEITRRKEELEKENTSLKETLKGIFAATQQYHSS